MLEIMILANLLLDESHAYKLKHDLKTLHPNNNTIYPLLTKLEEQGYIKGEIKQQQSRHYKTTYAITESGKTHFIDLLCDFSVKNAFNNDEFYIRVAFFQLLDQENIEKIIKTRQQALCAFSHAQEILDEMKDQTFPHELAMISSYTQKREDKELQFLQILKDKYSIG